MARYPPIVLTADVALIGGTGIGHRLAALGGTPIAIPTPHGLLRGKLIDYQNTKIIAVERHSAGHKNPPHKVNYKAIADALRRVNVKGVLSTAASGCLNPAWPVGTITVCTDFIDATARNITMFDQKVEHRDFTTPFPLATALSETAQTNNIEAHYPCTYLCGNGPRYETPAEIKMFGTWGADLVGMTAASEAVVLREANVPYGLVGVVTNAAAGMGHPELTHEEVVEVMEERGQTVVELLLATAVHITHN